MKYILLIALLNMSNSNVMIVSGSEGHMKLSPHYDSTPTMFGGIFDTEKECMDRAKGETSDVRSSQAYCVTVNGYDRAAQSDKFTPFKEVK